ncbi:hypothetical protein L7F22_017370 [Adiantum nelumboides]|nr:hypothetical protein [Adiantum nelumboides]
MGLLDKLWDDVVAGPQPERAYTFYSRGCQDSFLLCGISSFDHEKFKRSGSLPISPALGSPAARDRENIWTTVFHPGSNKHMKKLGSEKFDKHVPNSPTVYDCLVLSALDR